MADPSFSFSDSLARFRESFRIPEGASGSVRGSRTGELIARCVVECGTSSFYSAIRDSADEPVLKAICHRIAGDEFRHYKLFRQQYRRYSERQPLSALKRLPWVLLTACYSSSAVEGLPCTDDQACGPDHVCALGYCRAELDDAPPHD